MRRKPLWLSSTAFTSVVVCDFEYETVNGEYGLAVGDLPEVLCMVAYVLDGNLQHVRPSGGGAASSVLRHRSTLMTTYYLLLIPPRRK